MATTTSTRILPRPKSGEVRVRLAAVGMSALGLQAAGFIEAVGPEAAGFAPGDRVAYPAAAANKGLRPVVSERDLIGFPKDVPIDKAVGFLPLGLIARMVVRQLHSIGNGNTVYVAPDSAAAFVTAWVRHLGGVIVDDASSAEVVISSGDYAIARSWRNGAGSGQQAASDVFTMVRKGVFDAIPLPTYPLSDAARLRSVVEAGPVVLLPAEEFEKAA
jgi:NADPH:quinone reductase-like Zn-dependent oxidoreductase